MDINITIDRGRDRGVGLDIAIDIKTTTQIMTAASYHNTNGCLYHFDGSRRYRKVEYLGCPELRYPVVDIDMKTDRVHM